MAAASFIGKQLQKISSLKQTKTEDVRKMTFHPIKTTVYTLFIWNKTYLFVNLHL